jgi:ketosteroid isomerase-like protein
MTTIELARTVAALCAEARFGEVQDRFWTDDIVTSEAIEGPMASLHGRAAAMEKVNWWNANHTVHGCTVEGPFVNGDQFALRMTLDVTPKDGERVAMTEIVLYDTQAGRITRETYFYAM